MARKNTKADIRGQDDANASPKCFSTPTTTSTRTRRGLPVDIDNDQDRSAKRLKANGTQSDKAADNLHLSTAGQTVTAFPNGREGEITLPSTKHLSINKRQREDGEAQEISPTASKRSKLHGSTGLNDVPQSRTPNTEASRPSETVLITASDPTHLVEDQVLPLELQRFASHYEFSTMSIRSSAKIESRVRNLLQRVQRFSFADTKAKPGIVILRAKADVAAKLCSVVELAKQQIVKDKANWWQYNKLHGELLEQKPQRLGRTQSGKTLSKGGRVQPQIVITGAKATGEREEGSATGRKAETIGEEGNVSRDDLFETMINPKLRDQKASRPGSYDGKKVRNTPIMTIIFAMVPVPGLKELYGEQTNA